MSAKSKLRDLRIRETALIDIPIIRKQIEALPNDRGAAILATTLVENGLAAALRSRMPSLLRHKARVFDAQGPLNSLDDRISMALALEIFGSDTHHDLDLIKHIRNTFAHTSVPIDFKTEEIVLACSELKNKGEMSTNARHEFMFCCVSYAAKLLEYGKGCYYGRASDAEQTAMVVVPPRPLP